MMPPPITVTCFIAVMADGEVEKPLFNMRTVCAILIKILQIRDLELYCKLSNQNKAPIIHKHSPRNVSSPKVKSLRVPGIYQSNSQHCLLKVIDTANCYDWK
jgi:hypothetical protein